MTSVFEPKQHFQQVEKVENLFSRVIDYINIEHYKNQGKRLWDLGAAVPIALCLLPLFLVLSIMIKLDSKGPVFYRQKRVGKNGDLFDCYKFRTMKDGSESLSATTSDNDQRITRLGKVIRPISLDEMPQLINILKGDMSFIGPRPISDHEYQTVKSTNLFSEQFLQDLVPKVRPGILGWAIFQGREKISYENRCKLNKEYEQKISLLFDSYISLLTLKKYWFSYLVVTTLFTLSSLFVITQF